MSSSPRPMTQPMLQSTVDQPKITQARKSRVSANHLATSRNSSKSIAPVVRPPVLPVNPGGR